MLLFVFTHVPLPKGPAPRWPQADKVVHFLLYFGLAWLGGRRLLVNQSRFSVRSLIAWAGVYAAFAVADEWLQGPVGRTPSVGDWLADVIGIGAASIGLWIMYGRSSVRSDALERGGV